MAKRHTERVMHSSLDPGWRTPPECFAALDKEFSFGIDAAANEDDHLCPCWWGPDSPASHPDALDMDESWHEAAEHWPIFLNPPYSKTLAAEYRKQGHEEKAKAYEIESWAQACYMEALKGATIVGLFPFSPQTEWYRRFVMGFGFDDPRNPHTSPLSTWSGFAATEERRLPHRISFLRPDGTEADNAGVNSVVIVWRPAVGIVGPWTPLTRYWSYR